MNTRHPYVRGMEPGWWWKNAFLLRYMIREMTSLLVAAYAFVLLAGLFALSRGEAAYRQWLDVMASPWSVAFHGLLLAVFLYHSWSWFEIMPKTLPQIWLGGRRLPAAAITWGGLAATLACCGILLGGTLWLTR